MIDSPIRSRAVWLLLPILMVGAFLRFNGIGRTSLWMDEIWSIEISTGRGSEHDLLPVGEVQTRQIELTSLSGDRPWWDIWTSMRGVTHPPLYHVILRWWMDLLGNGAGETRALSAVCSLASVFVLFDICQMLYGTRIALLAAAIMAFARHNSNSRGKLGVIRF